MWIPNRSESTIGVKKVVQGAQKLPGQYIDSMVFKRSELRSYLLVQYLTFHKNAYWKPDSHVIARQCHLNLRR